MDRFTRRDQKRFRFRVSFASKYLLGFALGFHSFGSFQNTKRQIQTKVFYFGNMR